MPVLLDTHAFLWWCEGSPELSKKARNVMTAEDCFVSYASFWEIAIKVSLGKLRLPGIMDRYLAAQMSLNGFEQMEISFRQIMRCACGRNCLSAAVTHHFRAIHFRFCTRLRRCGWT